MNYIKDILRSGMGERAVLFKQESDLNEWGDESVNSEDSYEFETIVDSLDRAEREEEPGDFIEGDIRFYVSSDCTAPFEHGDIIEYDGRKYNIDTVRSKTLGSKASHKEIIAETV